MANWGELPQSYLDATHRQAFNEFIGDNIGLIAAESNKIPEWLEKEIG